MKKSIVITVLTGLLMFCCRKKCENSNRCNLIPNSGACLAAIPKYYYDQNEKKCKQFTWGGCGGVVPFETLEDCENACGCNK